MQLMSPKIALYLFNFVFALVIDSARNLMVLYSIVVETPNSKSTLYLGVGDKAFNSTTQD